eukprot:639580-Pleurochrysis_carterae.AAC.1
MGSRARRSAHTETRDTRKGTRKRHRRIRAGNDAHSVRRPRHRDAHVPKYVADLMVCMLTAKD